MADNSSTLCTVYHNLGSGLNMRFLRISGKKIMSLLLAVCLCLANPAVSFATGTSGETTEHPKTTEYPNNPGLEPDIVSQAAVVMDAATGQVLYEKNADIGKYPASITKIMTILIVLEHNVSPDYVVTMSENAIWGIERTSTNIGLDVGEQVTVRDLMYATMVKSANECAYALAELVAGNVEAFADMMNEKAQELGCKHTHFVTPNGLHDDDHYTTAYDMALIMRAAIQNEQFREIAGTVSYTVPATNLTDETRPLWTGNWMINPAKSCYYEYCEGGKNGYTTNANNTLVTYAKKDGLELICVVLDCDGQEFTFTDSRALYNYCYNNYMYFYPLSDFSFQTESDEEDTNFILDNYYNSLDHDLVHLTVDKNYCLLLHKSTDTTQIEKEVHLYDQVSGNVLGEIDFLYKGEQLGSTPITNSVPSLTSKLAASEMTTEEPSNLSPVKKRLLIMGCAAGALIVILLLVAGIHSLVQTRKINERRRRNTSIHRERQRRRKQRRKRDDYYF